MLLPTILLQAASQPFGGLFQPGIATDVFYGAVLLVIAILAYEEMDKAKLIQKWLGGTFGVKKNIADDSIEPGNVPHVTTFINVKTGKVKLISKGFPISEDEFGNWDGNLQFTDGTHISGVKSYQLDIPVSLDLIKGDVVPILYNPDGFGNKEGRNVANLLQKLSRLGLENKCLKTELMDKTVAISEQMAFVKENIGKTFRSATNTGKRQFRSIKDVDKVTQTENPSPNTDNADQTPAAEDFDSYT